MADATFEWLVQNPWVMREYAFHWLAVDEDGLAFAEERLEQLMERVQDSGVAERIRLVYAYTADDSGTPAMAGEDGDQHHV